MSDEKLKPCHMSNEMAALGGTIAAMHTKWMQREELMRTEGGLDLMVQMADLLDGIVDAVPELQRRYFEALSTPPPSPELKQQARELLAVLHEIQGNGPAAFTVRSVGAVGTVLAEQQETIEKALSSSNEPATRLWETIREEAPEGELVGVQLWPDGDWDVLKPGRVKFVADTSALSTRSTPSIDGVEGLIGRLRATSARLQTLVVIQGSAADTDRENVDAAIEALASLPTIGRGVSEQWQPIETAPKDGTRALLWHINQHPSASKHGYPQTGSFRIYDPGVKSWRADSGALLHPTHWMPLPVPPALSQSSGEGGGG